jgi:hypothetical protein
VVAAAVVVVAVVVVVVGKVNSAHPCTSSHTPS